MNKSVRQQLDQWLFHAGSPYTMAAFRIVFGLAIFIAQVMLWPDVAYFYSDEGVLPREFLFTFQNDVLWSLLHLGGSLSFVFGMYLLLLVVIVAVIVGCFTRLSSILLFVLIVSFRQRNPLIANSGDQLVAIVSFWLMFADAGRVWSVDSFWARGKVVSGEWSRTWVLRCLQVQLCFVYGCSAIQKLTVAEWVNGEALYYVLANPSLWYHSLPASVLDHPWLYRMMTYGTLTFELAYPLLIWHRTWWPVMIVSAVFFHLFIMFFMGIPFFSLYMISMQVLFLGVMFVRLPKN